MKANHNRNAGVFYLLYIERTKTKIKFESKSQPKMLECCHAGIERTKTKIKFESKSQHPTNAIFQETD